MSPPDQHRQVAPAPAQTTAIGVDASLHSQHPATEALRNSGPWRPAAAR